MARSRPAHMLYRDVTSIPARMMAIYRYACSNTSDGTLRARIKGRIPNRETPVNRMESTPLSSSIAATAWRSSSLLCAPKALAITIPYPLFNPDKKPMIREYIELVAPIAATAPLPKLCPATIVSTMLYTC